MKRVAILVAAVVFTLNLNIKVFATGVEDLNSAGVNQTTVGTETTQVSTASGVEQVIDNTSTATNINEETGIMPDSIFYLFDKAFDNIRLFLTFDEEKKIEILSQIADERLAESESMTQEEKYDLAKTAIEEFNNLITKASEELNVLVENNNEVIINEDKQMESTEVDLEHGEIKLENQEGDKLGELEKNILSKQLKSIEVLKKLSGKLEGNAKEVIEAVIEMQMAKKEAVAKMVEKRHELNAAREEYQLVKINLEAAKKAGDEEAIKVAEAALKEKQSLYQDAKAEFNVAFKEKKELKNDLKKNTKKVEKKKAEASKVEDDKLTSEESTPEVTEQSTVATPEEKTIKSENTNTENNIKDKKIKEDAVKKVKEEPIKKEESVKKVEPKLENKEIKNESIKDTEKKVKDEIKEKVKEEIKEKVNEIKEKKENKKN
jgi:hypothetical protein